MIKNVYFSKTAITAVAAVMPTFNTLDIWFGLVVSSVGKFLGHSLTILEEDGSITKNTPYALLLGYIH